jgi:uncharacterized membrane protein
MGYSTTGEAEQKKRGLNDSRAHEFFENGRRIVEATLIQQPRQRIFDFWRNFENLPQFMQHLEKVQTFDDGRSRWCAKAPAGTTIEWDAELINEKPGELIAWRSLTGSEVQNAGSVRFIDRGRRGTEVRVTMEFVPPAGKLGELMARITGEHPQHQVRSDLRRLRQLLETGEIPTTLGQPSGRDDDKVEEKEETR